MTVPKFAADVMLGKLAKWLRLMGFDTFYSNTAEDDFLVDLCLSEDRILLTRDGPLHDRIAHRCYFVKSIFVAEQLDELTERFQLHRYTLEPRCAVCNGTLSEIPKEGLADEAPPYVFKTVDEFYRCSGCGKLYWEGTHVPRIRTVIEKAHENGRSGDC